MIKMQIFEPAMCCSTGLCGVGVDPELLRISTVLDTLKNNGAHVDRFNLGETMSEEDIAYVEEDLRSPCTQEIAVFRAFADIVEKAEDQIVVIHTAPTGHTLLLLD